MSNETYFTAQTMRDYAMSILEGLESYPSDSEQWQSRLRRMYLLSMGVFKTEDDRPDPAAVTAAEELKMASKTAAADNSASASAATNEEEKKEETIPESES